MRRALRESTVRSFQPYLPPLETPILRAEPGSSVLTGIPTKRWLTSHLLISIENFLLSLPLLGTSRILVDSCPSISALYCDTLLRHDPYRAEGGHEASRLIMRHIDLHHNGLSHQLNLELGSTYIINPLPNARDNRCRCPLKWLESFYCPQRDPDVLADELHRCLAEVELFTTSLGVFDQTAASEYLYAWSNESENQKH